MNRKQFVDVLQDKFNNTTGIFANPVSKSKSDELLTLVLDAIEEVVDSEGKLQIVGHGTYEKKLVKGRTGVSKLQGVEKTWKTEDSYKPVFHAGKGFENRVNGLE